LFGTADIIHISTQHEAIADGVLIDATETAREAGWKWPTVITRAVFEACVKVPEGVTAQDPHGRLWDVVWLASRAAKRAKPSKCHIEFKVSVVDGVGKRGRETRHDYTLWAVVGPGDDGEPVVTIMFPGDY
jgi:hypothetical protein